MMLEIEGLNTLLNVGIYERHLNPIAAICRVR